MSVPDYSGYWTGTIQGTNSGGFAFEVHQNGGKVEGEARFHEPALGLYEYAFTGIAAEKLTLDMIPRRNAGDLGLGRVQVIAGFDAKGALVGRWKSDGGTEGVFQATRFDPKLTAELPRTNSVFVVHGHDEGAKHSVARFLEQLGIAPVISMGLTEFQEFETLDPVGITYKNTYFLNAKNAEDESLHFHELIHAVQWRALGPEAFLILYADGLAKYGYERCPLEQIAYAHQRRFSERHGPVYDVETEVLAETLALARLTI
jgi:hypothetical protein